MSLELFYLNKKYESNGIINKTLEMDLTKKDQLIIGLTGSGVISIINNSIKKDSRVLILSPYGLNRTYNPINNFQTIVKKYDNFQIELIKMSNENNYIFDLSCVMERAERVVFTQIMKILKSKEFKDFTIVLENIELFTKDLMVKGMNLKNTFIKEIIKLNNPKIYMAEHFTDVIDFDLDMDKIVEIKHFYTLLEDNRVSYYQNKKYVELEELFMLESGLSTFYNFVKSR